MTQPKPIEERIAKYFHDMGAVRGGQGQSDALLQKAQTELTRLRARIERADGLLSMFEFDHYSPRIVATVRAALAGKGGE